MGLRILTYLRTEGRSISLGELAHYVDSGKPSVLRLLRTLEHLGYIGRDADKKYRIGVAWPVVEAQDRARTLCHAAKQCCRELHNEYGETVSLAYLFDDHIRVVDVLESPHHVRMSNFQGRILQPYASSLGKAIAAFGSETQRRQLLDVYGVYPLTKRTLVDQRAIQAEFARVRDRGYSEDNEETVEGGYCIGAPIHAPGATVMGAISVSLPKFRASAQISEKLPSAVREAAKRISAFFAAELDGNP